MERVAHTPVEPSNEDAPNQIMLSYLLERHPELADEVRTQHDLERLMIQKAVEDAEKNRTRRREASDAAA